MSGSFSWTSAVLTHRGHVRSTNEDACAQHPERGLWVVADGMGGHEAGELASRRIVEVLADTARHDSPGDFVDEVEDRLFAVNRELVQLVADRSGIRVGSTVVVLLAFSRWAMCLWAGDSRVYRLRGSRLDPLTRDHSQVEELIERGHLKREEAATHPLANVITRAVGGGAELQLDLELQELADGDRYLLCSDGLLKELKEPDIARLLAGGSCEDACTRLVEGALAGEATDNITVAVVDFSERRPT